MERREGVRGASWKAEFEGKYLFVHVGHVPGFGIVVVEGRGDLVALIGWIRENTPRMNAAASQQAKSASSRHPKHGRTDDRI
jgi:hypothetical protein